jgi:hypothetical protein
MSRGKTMRVGEELLLVTVEGECFQARLRHKGYNPGRSSLETSWVLEDKVWERPSLRAVALLPDETCWQLEEEGITLDHDLVALNGIRRAFDCGELHFDDIASEVRGQKEVIVRPNAPGPERDFVPDARVRSLILHRAYWEGFKYGASSGHCLDFATDRDLEYIGVDRNAIQRNAWLLSKYGLLEPHRTQASMASPTPELVESCESGGAIAKETIQIFPADSQRESCNEIKKILQSAKSALTVADNYVDHTIMDMLSVLEPQVHIRILTEHLMPDFSLAIEKFLPRHQMALEVRTHARRIHDRFIVVDESRAYSLGASIKDAGKKLWHLHRLVDRVQLTKLKNLLGSEWDSAAAVWPPP